MRRKQIAETAAIIMRELKRPDITCEDVGLCRAIAARAGLTGLISEVRLKVLDSLEGHPSFKKSIQPFGRRLRVFTLVE